MEDNRYLCLGLKPECTTTQLKRAWHQFSLKNHPDFFADPTSKREAHARFTLVSDAYHEILSERTVHVLPAERADDYCVKMIATLEDAYFGRTVTVHLTLRRFCRSCYEARLIVSCSYCEGEGSSVLVMPTTDDDDNGKPPTCSIVRKECASCLGTGRRAGGPQCLVCCNLGLICESVELSVPIPRGAQSPCEIRLDSMGEDSLHADHRGDVVFFVNINSHCCKKHHVRVGDDLVCRVNMSLLDALNGNTIYVDHLNGLRLHVDATVPPPPSWLAAAAAAAAATTPWPSGHVVRCIEDGGMPRTHGGGYGNLYVHCLVQWPRQISPQRLGELSHVMERWLRDADSAAGEPPRKRPCVHDREIVGHIKPPVVCE